MKNITIWIDNNELHTGQSFGSGSTKRINSITNRRRFDYNSHKSNVEDQVNVMETILESWLSLNPTLQNQVLNDLPEETVNFLFSTKDELTERVKESLKALPTTNQSKESPLTDEDKKEVSSFVQGVVAGVKYLEEENKKIEYFEDKHLFGFKVGLLNQITNHYREERKRRFDLGLLEESPLEKRLKSIVGSHQAKFSLPKVDEAFVSLLKSKNLDWGVEVCHVESEFGLQGDYVLTVDGEAVFCVELKRTMVDLRKSIEKEFHNIIKQKMIADEVGVPFRFLYCSCYADEGLVEEIEPCEFVREKDWGWFRLGFDSDLKMYKEFRSSLQKLKRRNRRGGFGGLVTPNVHFGSVEMPWSVYQQPNIFSYSENRMVEQHRLVAMEILKWFVGAVAKVS